MPWVDRIGPTVWGKYACFFMRPGTVFLLIFFSTYKISMPREDFAEPEGWTWEGFWDSVPPNRFYVPIIPTLTPVDTLVNFHGLLICIFHSYTGDKDAEEVTFFEDDVFEYQTRAPATNWLRCESQYGDVVKYFS